MPGQQSKSFTSVGDNVLRIVGGKLSKKVDKGTEGAVYREWEVNGKSGDSYELIYDSWEGKIEGVEFRDNEFGTICDIKLEDVTISLPTDKRYFSDFAKKVQSGDLTKSFFFLPYDFEADDKRLTGISLQQGGVKLKNYYYDGEKNLHGFPEVDEEKKSRKGYWKMYFGEVEEFLIKELKGLSFSAGGEADIPEDLPWEDEK